MASLKDIASELDVSPSLVSKVLNDRLGNTGARPATIQAIQDKARQLGYRKNLSAVALRAGRQHAIGVFVHRHGRSGAGLIESLLEGISDQARAENHRLLLHFFQSADEFRSLRNDIHSGTMDGLILAGVAHTDLKEDITRFKQMGIAVVTIHNQNVAGAVPNIGMSQVEVGRAATAHLIERGCRRIAHLKQEAGRYEGYRQALHDAGIPFDPALIFAEKGNFAGELGAKAVESWLANRVAFDGLFAPCDEQAVEALNALMRARISVPDQVRVVGVDDAPYCRFSAVPLTSVSQRFRERGREAVRLLLSDTDVAATSVDFAPTLRPRLSSSRMTD